MGQVCSGDKPESKHPSAFQDVSEDTLQSGDHHRHILGDATQAQNNQSLNQQQQQVSSSSAQSQPSDAATAAEDRAKGERLKALREEQTRLDLIVSAAGRGMVAVRSTRGSTGYYDQGFAAALAQHLEQTTQFPNQLPIRLPPPPSAASALASTSVASPSKGSSSSTNSDGASGSSAGPAPSGGGGGSSSSGGKPGDDTTTAAGGSNGVYARLAQPPWQGIQLGNKGTGLAGCAGENPNTHMDHVAESLLEVVVPAKQQMLLGANPIIENLL
jgi:hypothetical protein